MSPSSGAGRFVALLRGINVGKAKRVAMADLRGLLEKLGHRDVRTLLNSGNAVFTVTKAGRGDLARQLERALLERLQLSCKVTVLSATELTQVIRENPLGKIADNPSRLLVSVMADPTDRPKLTPLTRQDWRPEAFGLGTRASYLWCPEGVIDSRVAKAVDKALGDGVTARNWSTMLKLHALASRLLLAFVVATLGCSRGEDSFACTMELRSGIDVEVRDSVTGAPIAAQASAVARWKSFVDTLRPARVEDGTTISLAGVPDRPGLYALTIEAPGYQNWERSGIRIRKGKCHVEMVKLVARLQPTVP